MLRYKLVLLVSFLKFRELHRCHVSTSKKRSLNPGGPFQLSKHCLIEVLCRHPKKSRKLKHFRDRRSITMLVWRMKKHWRELANKMIFYG